MTRLLVSVKLAPCSPTPRDAVRNGVDVFERDGILWRESYAPGSFVLPRAGATVELDHDTDAIGHVVTVAASGGWHYADLIVESDDPEVLARIRPGVPVSLGGRELASDTDLDLRLKRHLLVHLEHVAITKRGQRGAIPGAQILSVRKTAARSSESTMSSSDWMAGLPDDWRETLQRHGYKPGEVVELISGTRVEYRWTALR